MRVQIAVRFTNTQSQVITPTSNVQSASVVFGGLPGPSGPRGFPGPAGADGSSEEPPIDLTVLFENAIV